MIIDMTQTATEKQLALHDTFSLFCRACKTINYLPMTGGVDGECDCSNCRKPFAVITYLKDSVCAYTF